MRRSARLRSLALLAPLVASLAWPLLEADAEDQLLTVEVLEREHVIELTPGSEGATLEVTRRFFNPTMSHARLDLSIDLACSATIDRLRLRGRDDELGRASWAEAELVDPDLGQERLWASMDPQGPAQAIEGDTLALLTRPSWQGCAANLEIYPIPPLGERTVRYRVLVPSEYRAGEYVVELPKQGIDRLGAQIHVNQPPADLELAIDGQRGVDRPTVLDGEQPHQLALRTKAASRAELELASIELPASGSGPRSVALAQLDLPVQLAELPAVRRVVVVVDASHSFDESERDAAQGLVAAYLAKLDPALPVEILTFDREVQRVYGGFVPASWGAEDLAKLELETRNGSEAGQALARARELLIAERRPGEREGADWIVLLGDLELRRDFDLDAERLAAAASDVHLHVVEAGDERDTSLRPAALDSEWMAIAQAGGGAHFVQGRSLNPSDGAELVAPSRVWDLELVYSRADEDTGVLLASDLAAGESVRWLEVLEGAPVDRVRFEGFTWAGDPRWQATADAATSERWSRRLATDSDLPIALSGDDRAALARSGEVASAWTALLAEASFDGAAPGPTPSFSTRGIGGSWGSSTRCGGVTMGSRSARAPTISLESLLAEGISSCKPSASGELELELLGDEIVAVHASDRCIERAIWAIDVRGRGLPNELIEVHYGPRGELELVHERAPVDPSTPD